MVDARLQQLRRAWDEGGLETQVRLLRERMRAGELTEERVRLAAWAGDLASREVVGSDMPESGSPAWSRAACEVDFRAGVRVALVLSRLALEATWSGHNRDAVRAYDPRTNDRAFLEGYLNGVENWLLDRVPGERLLGAAELARETSGRKWFGKKRSARAIALLLEAIAEEDGQRLPRALDLFHKIVSQIPQELAERELVPWALGLRDPVAERVAAREAGE